MQKKTIGSFLAALRKANGMTQQELADRLNVSNKAISRWERDECAPDIILIPVIAEIFGVTSDELLRGERQPIASHDNLSHESRKTEKQLRYILNSQLTRFKTATLLSTGLVLIGLITLFISGYGFYRAVLGFGLALILYTASILHQAAFTTRALSLVDEQDFEGTQLQGYRMTVLRLSMRIVYLNIFILCISLPLVLLRNSSLPTSILNFRTWILTLPGTMFLAFVFCIIVSLLLDKHILGQENLHNSDRTITGIQTNHTQKKRLFISGLILILATFLIQTAVNRPMGPTAFAEAIAFETFEEFKEFAETPMEYNRRTGADIAVERVQSPDSIFEPSIIHDRMLFSDPHNSSNSYLHLNETISVIQWERPILVFTRDEIARGQRSLQTINGLFIALYILEFLACVIAYLRSRVKVQYE